MRQFLTNEEGERTAVVLPVGEYEKLLERAEDAEALRPPTRPSRRSLAARTKWSR